LNKTKTSSVCTQKFHNDVIVKSTGKRMKPSWFH